MPTSSALWTSCKLSCMMQAHLEGAGQSGTGAAEAAQPAQLMYRICKTLINIRAHAGEKDKVEAEEKAEREATDKVKREQEAAEAARKEQEAAMAVEASKQVQILSCSGNARPTPCRQLCTLKL